MPIDPIVIRFATAGMPEVNAAFESTAARARKFEDEMSGASQRGSRARVTTAEKEAREKERLALRAEKEAEKAELQKSKVAEREAAKRAAAEKKAADSASRDVLRAAKEEAREVERLEEQKLRVKIRAAERAAREGERINRHMAKIQSDVFREEERAENRRVSGIGKAVGKGLTGFGSAVKSVASMAGGAAALAGGFEFAKAIRQEGDDERAVGLLINSATQNGVVAAGANRENILGQLSGVSVKRDVKRSELIEGVQNYVALAGADQFGNAMANADFFAKMATASGSSFKDITGAAGILQAQNKNLGPKEMQQMMLDLMAQGKAGAVEIKDLASLAGGLGSTRGLYQGSVTENQRKLLALAQVTRTEGTSAEEAMVAVKDLGVEAVGKAAKSTAPQWLRNAVDAKTGQIKGGPEQLIEAALLGTGGNLGELTHIFGQRGSKAFDRLAPLFNEAGGGQKGIEAIRKEMAPMLNVRGNAGELDEQFAQVMESPGKKLETAINAIATQMDNAMAPALASFAKKLSDPEVEKQIDTLISAVGKLAEFLIENPLKGAGLALLTKVTADVAQAQIGEGLKAVLTKTLAGSLNDKLLAGLNIATASLIVGSLLMGGTGEKETSRLTSGAEGDVAAIASGKVEASDLAVQQRRSRLVQKQSELKEKVAQGPAGSLSDVPYVGTALNAILPESDPFFVNLKKQLADVTKSLQELDAATKKASGGVKSIPPVTAGQPAHPIGSSARSG